MSEAWRAGGAARAAVDESARGEGLPTALRMALARSDLGLDAAHLAWELVRLTDAGPDALALALLLQEALARGSTRLSLRDAGTLEARARALLDASPPRLEALRAFAAEVADAPEAHAPLFGSASSRAPLIVDGEHLYVHRVRAAEVRLVDRIRLRLSRRDAAPEGFETALLDVWNRPAGDIVLTDEQEHAVRRAVSEPLCRVAGGPGTGKTSIVLAILRTAARLGVPVPSIALAAPTGKAADRTRGAIERGLASIADPSEHDLALARGLASPRTLHRLLGYRPSAGGFRHHAENPLSEQLVIVDESSMIDLFLMDSLLAALRSEAGLVLLGDAEQLPSVAAGAVFRDLGEVERVPSVRLEKSHRMDPSQPEGFHILSVAQAVNRGARLALAGVAGAPLLPAAPERFGRLESLPSGDFGGAFLFEGPTVELLDWWQERFRVRPRGPVDLQDVEALEAAFTQLERARLLCVTRSGARPTGVEAVNGWLHGPGRWRPGEPVLVHRNDYARGLFNGDQGLLLDVRTDDGPRLRAVFRRADGFVAHPLEAIRPVVELGYATTVHKAQGSEHDIVGLILPDTDSPRLLTREVVYTAITRARRAVVVAGALPLLDRAVSRAIERSTGLGERLR